jgi:hypothetical protein
MATAAEMHEAQPSGRKVVDELSGWLRLLEDGSVDRTWTGPPEALPLMQPVAPYAVPRDGHTLNDLPGEPNLRVYLPEARSEGCLPVIVHLHGGGFYISHPSWLMYHHFYARLLCAVPAVVVSVDFPLAPESRLPAHIDTGVTALRRLRGIIAQSEAGALDNDPATELLGDVVDMHLPRVPHRGQLRRQPGSLRRSAQWPRPRRRLGAPPRGRRRPDPRGGGRSWR